MVCTISFSNQNFQAFCVNGKRPRNPFSAMNADFIVHWHFHTTSILLMARKMVTEVFQLFSSRRRNNSPYSFLTDNPDASIYPNDTNSYFTLRFDSSSLLEWSNHLSTKNKAVMLIGDGVDISKGSSLISAGADK